AAPSPPTGGGLGGSAHNTSLVTPGPTPKHLWRDDCSQRSSGSQPPTAGGLLSPFTGPIMHQEEPGICQESLKHLSQCRTQTRPGASATHGCARQAGRRYRGCCRAPGKQLGGVLQMRAHARVK
uniref:Uncharacterized protein n=1 Tax=Gopherus evgoodei TaxID=1825980 RepID=A0A8C4WRR2_9SAUR